MKERGRFHKSNKNKFVFIKQSNVNITIGIPTYLPKLMDICMVYNTYNQYSIFECTTKA